MPLIGAIIALIGLVATLYGLFLGIFRKGRRKRGWIITLVSLFIALPLGVALVPVSDTPPASQLEAKTEPSSGEKSQPGAEEKVTTQKAKEKEPADPDLLRLATANALETYCDGLQRYDTMIAEADTRFKDPSSDAHYNWTQEQDALISQSVTDTLGVPSTKWTAYAYQNGWDHRCDAIVRGWLQVELADIKEASRNDRNRVSDAIKREYESRLKSNEGDFYFDKENFGGVECRTKTFADIDIIGCRMVEGWGSRLKHSSTIFYTAAQIGDQPVIVPLDNVGTEHMRKPRYPDADNTALRVGKYVGPYPLPGIDWAEVKREFEG